MTWLIVKYAVTALIVVLVSELAKRGERAGALVASLPLVLTEDSGVRYYDNQSLDGGHLLVMLTNAGWISGKQILSARIKAGQVDGKNLPNKQDRVSQS